MLLDGEEIKNSADELTRLLEYLTKVDLDQEGSEKREEIIKSLKNIYYPNSDAEPYRHDPSSITGLLLKCAHTAREEEEARNPCYIPEKMAEYADILDANLTIVLRNNFDEIVECDKTIDRVYLLDSVKSLKDLLRLSSNQAKVLSEISGELIQNQKEQVENLETEIKKAKTKLKDVRKKLNKSQRESIAILGIFAGLVLAFNSGIQFSISGIQSVDHISPWIVACIVSLVGFVLFNAFVVMFTFIWKIVRAPKNETVIITKETWGKINFGFFVAMVIFIILHYLLPIY